MAQATPSAQAQKKLVQGPCNPPKNLLGVQVVYVDKDSVVRCVWLDLAAMGGISWCDKEPPKKNKPPKGKKPPATPEPNFGNCKPMVVTSVTHSGGAMPGTGDNGNPEPIFMEGGGGDAPPICWWTGSQWECGEE